MSNHLQVTSWLRSYRSRHWDQDVLGSHMPYKKPYKNPKDGANSSQQTESAHKKRATKTPVDEPKYTNRSTDGFLKIPKKFKDWSSYWDEEKRKQDETEVKKAVEAVLRPQIPKSQITMEYVKSCMATKAAAKKKLQDDKELAAKMDKQEDRQLAEKRDKHNAEEKDPIEGDEEDFAAELEQQLEEIEEVDDHEDNFIEEADDHEDNFIEEADDHEENFQASISKKLGNQEENVEDNMEDQMEDVEIPTFAHVDSITFIAHNSNQNKQVANFEGGIDVTMIQEKEDLTKCMEVPEETEEFGDNALHFLEAEGEILMSLSLPEEKNDVPPPVEELSSHPGEGLQEESALNIPKTQMESTLEFVVPQEEFFLQQDKHALQIKENKDNFGDLNCEEDTLPLPIEDFGGKVDKDEDALFLSMLGSIVSWDASVQNADGKK
ncbi:unnamed protein product [Calypogeia fissa]